MTRTTAGTVDKRRPRRSRAVIAASRMTERDRQILVMLAKHHVLTTHQIRRLFFDCPRVARRRVQVLQQVGLIDTFRPILSVGSAPRHCVITPLGGNAVEGLIDAAHAATFRKDAAEAIAVRPDLGHLIGVNDVFTRLAEHARRHQDAELELWWSERACTRTLGTYIRPEGFGRWREAGRSIDFFLEFDTGTEPLSTVVAKLDGYAALTEATVRTAPVLFWLHSARRESELHRRLDADRVPVATAYGSPATTDPAGTVWRRAGVDREDRCGLIDVLLPRARP